MDYEAIHFSRRFDDIAKNEKAPSLLTLEDAEAEYFADMAFDPRLELALENLSPSILAEYKHTTTTHIGGIGNRYLTSNTYIDRLITFDDDSAELLPEPAYNYNMLGILQKANGQIGIDLTILPDDETLDRIRITNTGASKDVFSIAKTNRNTTLDFDLLSAEDVFTLLCQLSGTTDKLSTESHLNDLRANPGYSPEILSDSMEKLWSVMAETYGKKESTYQLSHTVKEPFIPNNPETIDLFYKEIETPESSQIEFSLVHNTHYTDLATDESHRLYMLFDFSTEEPLAKKAEKIVHSNGARMKTFAATRQIDGKITPLNLDVSTIKEMFINWFDTVISNPEDSNL